MSTSLFNAQPYDEAKARRRRIWIAIAIVAVIAIATLLWFQPLLARRTAGQPIFCSVAGEKLRGRLRHLDE